MPNESDIRWLKVFLGFMSACSRIRDYDALLRLVAKRTPWLIQYDRLTILLCDRYRQVRRTFQIEDGNWHEIFPEQIQQLEMSSMLGTLHTDETSADSSRICMPLRSAGYIHGMLCLSAKNGKFANPNVQIVHLIADCLAATLGRLDPNILLIEPLEDASSAAHWYEESRRLSYLDRHDALTGLPNRWLLNERLTWAISAAKRYGRSLAVLFVDLDHFKNINDSLGHGIGDQVLREISNRLVKCVRSSDTVSRIGGDEFLVLLAEIENEAHAAICAAKIVGAVTAPLRIDSNELRPALSIGIGIYPGDGEDAETLMRNADTAMYHAKVKGSEEFQFFRQDMRVVGLHRENLLQSVAIPTRYR